MPKPATVADTMSLGVYLRNCRNRLDPAALGLSDTRRRTPGLRREEVAQRANISATWYTWLEQGRGGAPSAEVLHRIAEALMLTEVEREHAFILALGRSPEICYRPVEGITPRLQRVLDSFGTTPAMVRNAMWDVVAWNRAATVVLTDYPSLEPRERNVLRRMFLDPKTKAAQLDWEAVAGFMVAVFRADAARAGANTDMQALAQELCAASPDFARLWCDNVVQQLGEGIKQIHHPVAGLLALEYSTFIVDGRPDLAMLVYSPANEEVAEAIGKLMAAS
ncbi:helix-turn-helix transcriptional regulator [Pseudomonas asiatica]|uniref:helix-turn-helix transcriptional regulator n=1 Tax=Pseudomonas asiatica TaxID=2219225 RepID=UPI001FB9F156|nr:helix-turn-helix transcriptional regulator [Pseudomonas asiatica]